MGEILIYPNKVLRKKTSEIKSVDADLLNEIETLKKQLIEAENGVGLAAPQIGISKRFFGIKDENKKIKVIINPKIKITFGEKTFPVMVKEKSADAKSFGETTEDFLEGCLSFPNFWGTAKRWLKIKVRWQEVVDKKLVSKKEVLEGFKAIVWQHESDHLDGIVFVDHIKADKGKFFKSVEGKMKPWDIDKII